MRNQRGGAKVETVFKIVMVFFMALLAFSVGTIVGKQFSDISHKKAALEGEDGGDRSTASISDDATKVEPGNAIPEDELERLAQAHEADIEEPSKVTEESHSASAHSEHNTVAKKDAHSEEAPSHGAAETHSKDSHKAETATHNSGHEDAHADQHAKTQHKAEPKKEVSEHKKSASVHDDYTQYAQKIAKNEIVEPPKAAHRREPSSLPGEVGAPMIGKITVQLGSFQTEAEAKNKVNALKEKGLSAFFVPAAVKGKTWYRVGTGSFDKKDEAIEFQKKLAKEYGLSNTILNKITAN